MTEINFEGGDDEPYAGQEEEDLFPVKNPLAELRKCFDDLDLVEVPIKAYVVPYHDEHINEYLPDCAKRLKYLTGFTGLAGTAIITQTDTCLWTDSRFYHLAEREIFPGWVLMRTGLPSVPNESDWLRTKLPPGSYVGADAKVIPYPMWNSFKDELNQWGIVLIPVVKNLVDLVWGYDKPIAPNNKLIRVPIEYSGMAASQKLLKVYEKMKSNNVDMLIICALDDIAWLLNLRGSDVPYNPLFYAFAVIIKLNVHVFISEYQITDKIRNHFQREDICIRLHPYENFYTFVKEIVIAEKAHVNKVWIPSITPFAVYDLIPEEKQFCECSPIQLMKAIKTEKEVEGMINAHIKDGIALCQFFCWLESQWKTEEITEMDAVTKLEFFQMKEALYVGSSLQTISAMGKSSSKPHYTPSIYENNPLNDRNVYLLEAGAHYQDGTTGIARMIHLGFPSEFQRECYTRVLKGLIYLSTSIFPPRVKGNVLDCLARKHLWTVGLDYGHATGHGLGCFLNMHEGPMGISWRPYPDDPGLAVNMFISNGPGFYNAAEDNMFGIRIMNILQVVPSEAPFKHQDKTFLKFDTVSLCPIQIKMVLVELLTPSEIMFIDQYHSRVLEILGPILKHRGLFQVNEWLEAVTAPLLQQAIPLEETESEEKPFPEPQA
ncbi:xaa-Pro aminopeptidase ApepP-like [Cimex lectularius]|uniref:Xaa-Pro aminopeptidase n=1 Tax=Cimex lectularius TaxID=79782 RepID=A0A8I6SJQ6_CIMLE|nr:xaa-Pro aminopeptidase ApepP-like [Cimex lectularius]